MTLSDTNNTAGSNTPATFLSLAAAAAIFGAVSSVTYWWAPASRVHIFPSGSHALFFAGVLCLIAFSLNRFTLAGLRLNTWGFTGGLLLVFFSDWLCRGYNLFQGPSIRGEIILFSLISAVILRRMPKRFFEMWTIAGLALLAACFLLESEGRILFSDDHSSFIFRLSLLKENFPRIPFYYPLWNGGINARDFFSTGALNIFLINFPLIKLFDVTRIYNYVIVNSLFVLLPLCVFLAARIEKVPAPGPAIAALLSVSASLLWYRWALKYGTMGFVTSAALAPLNLALLCKLLSRERDFSLLNAVLLVLAFSLMALWTPSSLIFVPAAAAVLLNVRSVLKRRHAVLAAAIFVCLNVPWIVLFISVSNVGKFLRAETAIHNTAYQDDEQDSVSGQLTPRTFRHRGAGVLNLKKSLKIVRETAVSTNPLILFTAVPGLLLLGAASRRLYAATAVWLLFLGSIAVPLKPQLELDRMLIVLTIIMCTPTASALQQLFTAARGSARLALASLTCGFLLTGLFCAAGLLSNRTMEQYFFARDSVARMAAAVQEHAAGGRVLFSGQVLHELSDGHFAPLAVISGQPLVASSPFHTLWQYTQVFPRSYLERNFNGIREYLNVYNVTAVFAHDPKWRNKFLERPEEYQMVWSEGPFLLFKRLDYSSNYFHKGSGEFVSQTSNSVTVRLHSKDAVLKFNYFPFLQSSTCRISPERVSPEVKLIKLSDCPENATVTINSQPPWRRVFK